MIIFKNKTRKYDCIFKILNNQIMKYKFYIKIIRKYCYSIKSCLKQCYENWIVRGLVLGSAGRTNRFTMQK